MHDPQHDADDEVDLRLERRDDPPERPGARRDPVGEAVRRDGLRHVAAAAGRREAAAEHLVAEPLADDVALAGELRLVDADVARDQPAVEHDLVAGLDRDEVAEHELLGRDLGDLAGPDHRRRGPREEGDPVERPLGADLLDDPDDDVGRDDAQGHEGVHRPADQHERDAQREQDVVDEREDVLAQDLRVGPGGRRRRGVAVARGAPALDLGVVEAAVRRGDRSG